MGENLRKVKNFAYQASNRILLPMVLGLTSVAAGVSIAYSDRPEILEKTA